MSDFEILKPAPLDPAAEQFMIPMRDGVRLATDVYLPPGHGRAPTVLIRLPYDKCGRYTFMPQCAPYFNNRGYAFVVQDVRGAFRSEGESQFVANEVEDGYDTLEWVAAQPWCNGQVGMFGDSYYGTTQWCAVASGHPALKAIVPRVTTAIMGNESKWSDTIHPMFWTVGMVRGCIDRHNYDFSFELNWNLRPIASIFEELFKAAGARSASYDLMVKNEGIAAMPLGKHPFKMLKIPVLNTAGWFDYSKQFWDYETLTARAKLRPLQYLIADSIDHENYHLHDVPITEDKDHNVNDKALERLLPRYLNPALDFFDVFLKGKGCAESIPRARWFLGNDDWHTSPTWPPPEATEMRLYLGSPQKATKDIEGGTLLPVAESDTSTTNWIHDPSNLVPSTCIEHTRYLYEWHDERSVQGRDDVLTFTSEPSGEPLDLAGPVDVYLTLSSSCSSMHVYAKLCDVYPDGSTHMLVRGEMLVKEADYRRPVEFRMLTHTAYRLLPGHRLRLALASSDFPQFLWHPGTDESPWFAKVGKTNKQTIATGGASSCVKLTILAR